MGIVPIPNGATPVQGQDPMSFVREGMGIVQRRWPVLVVVFAVVLAIGFVAASSSKPVYETSASVLVPSSMEVTGSGDPTNPYSQIISAAQSNGFDAQQQMLKSASLIEEAKRRAGIQPRPGVVPPSVTVDGHWDTRTIEITVEGGDPSEIAKLANTMAELHTEHISRSANSGYQESLRAAEMEKERAARTLAGAEQKLLAFERAHPGLDVQTEGASRTSEYAALQASVIEAQNNLEFTREQYNKVQARLGHEPVTLVEEVKKDNPRVARLRERLDSLSMEKTQSLIEFRPTSRVIRDLNRRIAQAKQQLAAEPLEIVNPAHVPNPALPALKQRLDELEDTLTAYQHRYADALARLQTKKQALDQLAPWVTQLRHLNRERDAAQSLYAQTSDRLEDLQIRARARQQVAGSPDVVASAQVPTLPSHSRRTKYLALFAGMALLLGCAAALLADVRDDRVSVQRTSQLRAPVLGHIPMVASGAHPVITDLPLDSPVTENYRCLRANLGFAALEAPIRTIVVTSPQNGEGKSTVAVNLAITMAMAGRSVLLVDADLRHPDIHRLLNLPPEPGLTDIITRGLPLEQALQRTEQGNLRVLSSGAVSADPADLLSREQMVRLIPELRELADVVIFDTPPCLSVTDARVLAAHVDGVLLVAMALQTRQRAIRRALQLLDWAYARTLGIVLNKTDGAEPSSPQNPRGRDSSALVSAAQKPELPPGSPPNVANTAANALRPGHLASYLGLFLFTVVLYFRPYELIPALSSFTSMALVVGLLTLLMFVPSQLSLEGNLTAPLREVKTVSLFCLTALLSIPLALSQGEAWELFSSTFIKAVVIFIVIVNVVRTESRLKGLMLLAVVVALYLGINAVRDYQQEHFYRYRRVEGALHGMFDNPNDLALHLVTVIPIAIGLLLASPNPLEKILYAVCAVVAVAGTVVTYSRAGFLGLVASLAVLTFRLGRRNPLAMSCLAIAAVAAFMTLVPPDYGGRVASILNPSLDATGSAVARQDQLTRSLVIALTHPLFGVGMGCFHVVGIQEQVTHNAYTQVAAELGLPALLFYLSFVVGPLKQLREIGRQPAGTPGRQRLQRLAIGLEASFIGYMVASFFASVAYLWTVYYLVGYAVCLRRMYDADATLSTSVTASRWAAGRYPRFARLQQHASTASL